MKQRRNLLIPFILFSYFFISLLPYHPNTISWSTCLSSPFIHLCVSLCSSTTPIISITTHDEMKILFNDPNCKHKHTQTENWLWGRVDGMRALVSYTHTHIYLIIIGMECHDNLTFFGTVYVSVYVWGCVASKSSKLSR